MAWLTRGDGGRQCDAGMGSDRIRGGPAAQLACARARGRRSERGGKREGRGSNGGPAAQLARARTGEEKRREGEGEGRGSAASGGGIASARCGWVRRNRKTLERSGLGFTCVRPSRSDRTAEVLVVTWLNHRSALGLNYI